MTGKDTQSLRKKKQAKVAQVKTEWRGKGAETRREEKRLRELHIVKLLYHKCIRGDETGVSK